jgi:hypothetical protein
VFPNDGEHAGGVDKRAYTVAAVERLRDTLRRHTVFVPGLRKWGDPRAGLLTGETWEKARGQVCRELDLSPEPGTDVDRWAARLDAAYRQLAEGLADNPSVRIEQRDGRDHLVLTGLDKLDEPPSLQQLRDDVDARLPVVQLPEVLLEAHAWTGCLDEFTHVSEATSRAGDLITSLAAVLVSQAMNVGMPAVSAAVVTSSSAARSSVTSRSRTAGARSTSSSQNRSTSVRRNVTASAFMPHRLTARTQRCQRM